MPTALHDISGSLYGSGSLIRHGFALLTDLIIHRLLQDTSAHATASTGFIAQLARTGFVLQVPCSLKDAIIHQELRLWKRGHTCFMVNGESSCVREAASWDMYS